MTEIEQLQAQIEELKKTVDDLKSGCVKVKPMKQVLQEKECEIFYKYLKKQDYHDHKFSVECKAQPGLTISYGARVSNIMDLFRKSIRDAARQVYRLNHFIENINSGYEQLFDKNIKTDEQLNEYLTVFENICKSVIGEIQADDFKVE